MRMAISLLVERGLVRSGMRKVARVMLKGRRGSTP